MTDEYQPVRRHRHESGFTLIELLVALTLLGFGLSLLFGGFRLGTRVWEAGDGIAGRVADYQVTHRIFSRFLDRAYPLPSDERGQDRILFAGSPKSVRFVARMPSYPDQPGFYVISLQLEETPDASRLTMTRQPYQPLEASSADRMHLQESRLFESPHRFEFSYFGADDPNEEPDWHEHWKNRHRPPDLVRLMSRDADGAEAEWPAIIARPSITMDAACVVNRRADRCRLIE